MYSVAAAQPDTQHVVLVPTTPGSSPHVVQIGWSGHQIWYVEERKEEEKGVHGLDLNEYDTPALNDIHLMLSLKGTDSCIFILILPPLLKCIINPVHDLHWCGCYYLGLH